MGYESILYVVLSYKIDDAWSTREINGKQMVWGDVVATYDLCKCYPVSDKMRHYPPTSRYIYADDGDTMITEDRYGAPLTEIPLRDAIRIIEKAQREDEYGYWRYAPCLAMLKAFAKAEEADSLAVLHYGY